jgi:hypothetical protein
MSTDPPRPILSHMIALVLFPLVLAIYFASEVWMWIGSQWRKRVL